MADKLDDAIRQNAQGPAKAAGDAGSVEQHKLTDQTAADRYGEPVLTVCRYDRPTCHLRQAVGGAWHGAWLENEQMPIKLIPETT